MCLKNDWQPWSVEANAMGTGCEGLVPRVRTGTIGGKSGLCDSHSPWMG